MDFRPGKYVRSGENFRDPPAGLTVAVGIMYAAPAGVFGRIVQQPGDFGLDLLPAGAH
jgi:hypothetical protein